MLDFVQQLSDDINNILFIKGERNGNYPFSHSLLIGDYLIDTGISANRLKRLKKEYPINKVLLSHWHEDHISGNHLLANSKFLCHAKDRLPIEDIEKILPYYNVENTNAGDEFLTILGFYGMKNTPIHECFKDNDIINIGDYLKLKVIFTPGHTAGHCGFFEVKSKIAFLGDMDLTRFPYYATIDSNLIDFENSIKKLKTFDIEIAVVGHRDPIEGRNNVKAELENFKSVILKRDERILSNLSEKKPTQSSDLKGMNLIYRRYNFEIFEVISELVMIEKHFEKFLKEDLVTIKDGGYILT
jgi:glyoxylase-like metal-dependent hydrolase (beta-lactamase superfamily II)